MRSVNFTAAIGRYLIAAIFLVSGIHKLITPTETQAYIAAAGLPPVPAFWAAAAVEVIGGAFLALGIATRFAALFLAAFTLLAAAFFHSNFTDPNQFNHFMKNLAIAGGLLQVVAFGSGGLAITRSKPKLA
ncbi:MAG: DoxX family protein [Rhodomicrobium sp.]